MSKSIIKYTSSAFVGKKGILPKDENGYYTVVLGALNVYNSASEYYVATQEVIKLFDSSSDLQRRIKSGVLYAELGHPKRRLPNGELLSPSEFYSRVLTIDERNICCHIAEVWLDFDYAKKYPKECTQDTIVIFGKVKPYGVHAQIAQDALENNKQNCCFSIRGFTDNRYVNSRVERTLTSIVTWDFVNEPGIAIAKKSYSPSLESFSLESFDETIDIKLMEKLTKDEELVNIACENKDIVKAMAEQVVRNSTKQSKSVLTSW